MHLAFLCFAISLIGVSRKFSNPVNGQLELQFFHTCKNCSFLNRARDIRFPFVQVFSNVTFPIWNTYVRGGNTSAFVFPETIVTLAEPDLSEFETTNVTWGYSFQVLFSLWCLFNIFCCVVFLLSKVKRKQLNDQGSYTVPLLVILTLTLELICNSWRFSFMVVDPWLCNTIYSEVNPPFFCCCFPKKF